MLSIRAGVGDVNFELYKKVNGAHTSLGSFGIETTTDQWYHSIGDNTLADAILDRLMHNSHRLNLKGESMRKIVAKME